MNEILETYIMTPEEEIKWLRQCVRELQQENETNKTIIEKQVKRIYELEQELNKHKRLIENIKQLELYEYELDYDYEEEPVDNYNSFNMDYYIENWFKVEELEEGVK